ncbi:MAG: hypothetical protein IT174_08465 [Acidobacteria bacterium]|nr:hypothetical protein [Acidobacteriota bacterium]
MANMKQADGKWTEAEKAGNQRPGGGSTAAGGADKGSSVGTGTAAARSIYDQAKETAGQAYEVAADKATTKLEETKTDISGGLASVAGSVRQVSDNLRGPEMQDHISQFTARYSELAAKKIENAAGYLERTNVREMYTDLENFARRNPAVYIGGAFALGLIAARFLKSGTEGLSDQPATPPAPRGHIDGQAVISPV